jgi:hypothetical protein
MSRKKGKRRITLSSTITQEAYDKVDELADNTTDGNMSRMIEILINTYWDGWLNAVSKIQQDGQN